MSTPRSTQLEFTSWSLCFVCAVLFLLCSFSFFEQVISPCHHFMVANGMRLQTPCLCAVPPLQSVSPNSPQILLYKCGLAEGKKIWGRIRGPPKNTQKNRVFGRLTPSCPTTLSTLQFGQNGRTRRVRKKRIFKCERLSLLRQRAHFVLLKVIFPLKPKTRGEKCAYFHKKWTHIPQRPICSLLG